eukprot:COSAG04_NODE_4580_length_2005_cov_2.719307_1_plen_386_part_00
MVASRARAALSLVLAAAAAAQQHVCDPGALGGCNVCDECCHIVGNQTAKCDACVALECAFDCDDAAEACSRQCVQHCWSEVTSAPCMKDCVSCRGFWLLLAVAIPYGGRLVVDFLLGEVKKRCGKRLACCQPKGRDGEGIDGAALLDEQATAAGEGFTMKKLQDDDSSSWADDSSSWADAVEANGLSPFGALWRGAARFLLWHVAQPAGYFAVYGCAVSAGEVDGLQTWLGGFVAAREALYLLTVLVCVVVNPAFLLVDVGASVHDTSGENEQRGYGFLALYVLAPEKFVALAADRGDESNLFLCALLGGALLDLCGVAALGAGLGAGSLPPALAVGYSVTALAAVCFIGILATDGDEDFKKVAAVGAVLAAAAFGVPLGLGLRG